VLLFNLFPVILYLRFSEGRANLANKKPVKLHYASKLRLYPTTEQAEIIHKHFGLTRYVYNRLLYLRNRYYQKTGSSLSSKTWINYLKYIKKQTPWWTSEFDSQVPQMSSRDLDTAYKNFFRRIKQGQTPGFPKFKSKHNPYQSFQYPQRVKIDIDNRKIYLPKIGWVKVRGIRKDYSYENIKTVTVSYESNDQYHVSLLLEDSVNCYPVNNNSETVGLDLGVAKFATLSDGTVFQLPESLEKKILKVKRKQRQLSRKRKGSKNFKKSSRKLARAHLKVRNIRKDMHHKIALQLSENQAVVVEDLKISNMSKSAKGTLENPGTNVAAKSGLNRSILQQGWFQFINILDYKLARNGNRLIKINPQYTSQTCSHCGSVSKDNRKTQETFKCLECGYSNNADVNAAKNILRLGLETMSAGSAA